MHQLAVVDQRRDLDLLERNLIERNLIMQRTRYTISYEPWSDEFADGWHWILAADIAPDPEGAEAA